MRSKLGTGSMDTQLTGLGHLLRDMPVSVPSFQRSYSWGEDQVEAFWQDLRAALISEQPVYFLGTVVLRVGPGAATVIDGQQRLATTSMLLAAIRDVFVERGDTARAQALEQQYVVATSLRSSTLEPRMALNTADRGFYEGYVIGRETRAQTVPTVESHEHIRDAFDYLASALRDDVEAAGPRWSERLLDWVDLLDQHARVIAVRVQDDADAFLIFEALNDRGLELAIADTIKNYLFGLARERITEAEDVWQVVTDAMEPALDKSDISTFLRQWWSSEHGATREKELYRAIRSTVQSSSEASDTLTDIARTAPLFAASVLPEHEVWLAYDGGARDAVESLLRFGVEQFRPLLLSALRSLEPLEVQKVLSGLVAWSARGLVVGGIGGGTTERAYAEAAVRVHTGRVADAEGVLRELSEVVATDEEFRSAFATRRVSKRRLARYYLLVLDRMREGVPNPHLVPDSVERDWVAVPVLPSSDPANAWSQHADPAARPGLSTQLGNMVLLPSDAVRDLSDVPARRLEQLQQTDLVRGIPSTPVWSEDQIFMRQAHMAEMATHAWPRRPWLLEATPTL